MDEGRGFIVSHQRVVLDLDWSGVITGSAQITIRPNQPSLKTVYLHASPSLRVSKVTLSTPSPSKFLPTPTSFALSQPFQPLPRRDPPLGLQSHIEIKRKTWSALSDRDLGELAIAVTGGWIRLNDDSTALAEIDIQIDYELVLGCGVIEGIVFDGESVYLSPTAYDSARIWTPCVDSLWERHTWELEFIVPAKIRDVQTMVVSSGELLEQVSCELKLHADVRQHILTPLQKPSSTTCTLTRSLFNTSLSLRDRLRPTSSPRAPKPSSDSVYRKTWIS